MNTTFMSLHKNYLIYLKRDKHYEKFKYNKGALMAETIIEIYGG
jgi:hypothetical protein